MKMTVKIGAALAVLMAATPMAAMAEGSTTDPAATNATTQTTAEVDAGKLIGQDVVDANSETIGEIDSVMVDADGKVRSVVIDVSSWLESEKLIAVPWTELQISGDNKVAINLTKESATAAATYAYADPAQKGTVFAEEPTGTGTANLGADPAAPAPATPDGTVADADAGTEPAMALGTPVKNNDGSINTSQLIGLAVEGSNGQNVGEIGEVILDDGGQVEGIVVDVGGFLGVGERPVLMAWEDVTLAGSGDEVKANVSATAESLKSMPVYERAAQ